jgi:hypothetical protein
LCERGVDAGAVAELLECRDLSDAPREHTIAKSERSDAATCLKNPATPGLPLRSPENGTCFAVPMTGCHWMSSVM